MNNNNHQRHSNSLLAFLLGGTVGAVIGLLYAPRAGKETREILIDEGNELVDNAVSSIRDARDKALSTIKEAQTSLENLNEETKRRLSKLQEIAKETLDEQKVSVKKGYSKAKEVVTD